MQYLLHLLLQCQYSSPFRHHAGWCLLEPSSRHAFPCYILHRHSYPHRSTVPYPYSLKGCLPILYCCRRLQGPHRHSTDTRRIQFWYSHPAHLLHSNLCPQSGSLCRLCFLCHLLLSGSKPYFDWLWGLNSRRQYPHSSLAALRK